MIRQSLLSTLLLLALAGQARGQYELGDIVQDFTLPDLQDQPTALHSHLGRVVVLNFFTTWCPGCNVEATHLENDIRLPYAAVGVDVVAIDIQEPLPLVQGWAAAQGVNYQILMAPDWELFQEFPQALSIPYNAVLAPDMSLRYAGPGFDLAAITAVIDEILAEGQVPVQSRSFDQVKALYLR